MQSDPAPYRSSRLRELFAAALELPTTEAQYVWAQSTCEQDPALGLQLLELLAAHHDHRLSPLDLAVQQLQRDTQVAAPPISGPPLDLSHPQFVRPYELIEPLGEGGMGTVYYAQQKAPLRRKVAVKVIKPGMDTREVIARFEAERQALALMDHPNIARVLDAGATDTGRPYFVMELVRGTPITEYCQKNKLSLPDRLQLFIDVCQAVQHAHVKGVVHRDLKPSNVLVTLYEDRPTIKVIDFGVAKALNQDLDERTRFTQFASLVGTPMYMSPEQAEMGRVDVDTRSDVYSLGVLLYELLTGTKPFSRETLTSAGLDEMRRIIREENPPRPSSRLTTLHASGDAALSAAAVEEHRRLAQHLRGELDWVVMKALEKDRDRRYQSASDFANDLQRFLADEPVEACPPSAAYRLSKLVRRGWLAAAAVIVALLVIGLATASRLALRATRAEQIARATQRDLQAAAHNQRKLLYDSDMLLASQAWRDNDSGQVAERLARHIPLAGESDLRGFEWHYLHRQQDVAGTEWGAAGPALYDLALSPDGTRLATVGQAAVLSLYDTATGKRLAAIPTGQQETNGVAFCPDGKRIAVAGDDGTLRLYDLATHSEILSVAAHERLAYRVAFTPDGRNIATCGRDDRVRLWDPMTGASLGTLNEHSSDIEYMVVTTRGQLAAGDRQARVSIWDPQTRQSVGQFHSPRGAAISTLACSGTGYLAHGTIDGELYIVEAVTGALVTRQRITDGVQSLAFAPGDNWLVLGDRSGNLRVIPFEEGLWNLAATRTWPAHQGRVYSVAVLSDGRRVVSIGQDGRMMVWTPWASSALRMVECHGPTDSVDAVDTATFAVGTESCVDLYDQHGNVLRDLTHEPGMWAVSVAKQAGQVFGLNSRTIVGWNVADGQEVFRLAASPEERFKNLRAAPDGRTLALFTLSPEGHHFLELVSVPAGKRLDRRRVPSAQSRDISADGRWLAYDSDNEVQVMDLATRQVQHHWQAHSGAIRSLKISADGRRMATTSADRTLKVWSFPEGRLLGSVLAHRTDTGCVAITADGSRIATAGADRMLRLWDGESLQLLWEYPPLLGAVHDLRFLPNDQRLVCLVGNKGLLILDGSPQLPPSPPP